MKCINIGCVNECSYSHQNKATGTIKYRPYCGRCHRLEYSGKPYPDGITRVKTDFCAVTGEYLDSSQLELDHIDGNDKNNDPGNVWTVSKNMHALKTKICGDGRRGHPQRSFSEALPVAHKIITKTPHQKEHVLGILRKIY